MSTLYFKQLLGGRDFGTSNAFASQMENFVYLIGDRDTKECLVVDPAWDIQGILDVAAKDGMKVVGALATHYHPDHVGGSIMGFNIQGLAELMDLNPCPVHAHKLEKQGMQHVTGLSSEDIIGHDSGDVVKVGDISVELLHTPGHTPGSMCFRLKDALVSGDTLFLQGCGRVDLPGGDPDQMFETLTQRLASVPGDTILFPGHAYGGESAPLSSVRRTNAMLRVKDLSTWSRIHGH
jgi:glyoxylase-like metal-dependent hydrolase (beta-lactamase superfamily II)